MELDSKNGILAMAGQALNMMLKLFAPEYRNKIWNYYRNFTNYLEERDVDITVFSHKNHR